MSGYLIRVGLDLTDDGGSGLGPVASNGGFEYIPIPEACDSRETRTYETAETRLETPFSEYAGVSSDHLLHFDPEFESYTYGEVGSGKCNSLNKMERGDLLVFCSGLSPVDGLDRPRIYAIGYFTVSEVHDLENLPPERRQEILDRYPDNAHVKREGLGPDRLHPDDSDRDRYPVIVAGDPDRSRLLDRAVPLSSATATGTGKWHQKYRPLGTAEHVLGLNSTDLKRSNPKKIRGPTADVRDWLDGDTQIETRERFRVPKVYNGNGGSKRDSSDNLGSPDLRSYVVATDSGFAPHVQNGLLSLATCKPMIRSPSQPGDWVVGVGGKDHDSSRQLVHAFRVEHTLPMSEYFTDNRFSDRRPTIENDSPRGDNIYAPREVVEGVETVDGSELPQSAHADADGQYERGYLGDELCYTHPGGAYFQLAGGKHDLRHYKKDVQKRGNREKALLSAEYYYFGDSGVEIPEEIAKTCVPGYGDNDGRRAHRTEYDGDFSSFIDWLRNNFRPGRHGQPASVDTEIDPSETTGPGC
jgi:hypothetical protein